MLIVALLPQLLQLLLREHGQDPVGHAGGREGGEGGEGGREGEREGEREGGREGGKEEGKERREGERGREGGRVLHAVLAAAWSMCPHRSAHLAEGFNWISIFRRLSKRSSRAFILRRVKGHM